MTLTVAERKKIRVFLCYCALAVFMFYVLFPLYWMLLTSLKTNEEISGAWKFPFWFERGATLFHYEELLFADWSNFTDFYVNTIWITVLVVAESLVISVLAAYSLSRMRFFGSEFLGTGVFCTYLVPATLLFIPMFQIMKWLGLLNSLWSLVVVYPTAIVPFCTWILIGFFNSIPRELDEAAFVDGASYFQMLWKVFLPVAKPGLVAATMFAFTQSWAGFIYPLAFIFQPHKQVLTAGTVYQLIKGDVMFWGELMAGALLASVPVVVLYAYLMDYYIAGLTAGSGK